MTVELEEEEWQLVGTVVIDSGACLVVDPTARRDAVYGPQDIDAATQAALVAESLTATLLTPDGQVIGTVVSAGYGADEYPVEVRYMPDEAGVVRVAEMRVRFIG